MTHQSDVPVLKFFEKNEVFYCVIDYPNVEKDLDENGKFILNNGFDSFDLGPNYDTAIKKYLAMVESYRCTIN